MSDDHPEEDDPNRVLARLAPSPGRRWAAISMLFCLGGLLVYLALSTPFEGWLTQVALVLCGLGALILAERMRRATATILTLRPSGLEDGAGRLLCRMDDIAGVERGAFAFKPSNGFLIRLKAPGVRTWEPGLWWRIGKRIGVGGVTDSGGAKYMADVIAFYIKEGRAP